MPTFSRFLALSALPLSAFAVPAAGALAAEDGARRSVPKVVIDTDFNTIGDDGQVLAMAAQLDAAGAIDLLGVTVASGNQWLSQGVADALKASSGWASRTGSASCSARRSCSGSTTRGSMRSTSIC